MQKKMKKNERDNDKGSFNILMEMPKFLECLGE